MKKKVAVIFGGVSSEHEVSVVSATNVIKGFNKDKYDVFLVGITKDGRWLLVDSVADLESGKWSDSQKKAILSPDRSDAGFIIEEDGQYRLEKIDVIFPVLHGLYGEDGTIQGLFEMSGLPYVGCGVLSSAAGMDKLSTKLYVERLGIRQAKFVFDIRKDMSGLEKTTERVERKLGYPVFVKPSSAGSSCGVSKARNREELEKAIELAKKHDTRVLIEEAINGREIECGVLGNEEVIASNVGEVIAAAEFYDYEAKYNNSESKTVINPDTLADEVKDEIRKDAVKIFKAIAGAGLSRVDFFVEDGTNEVIFNEINTLPGFTNISMYPMLLNDSGYGIEDLLDKLVELAYNR
ncbi:MAG: D-alanine--D-alanine ligase [Eubacterium sp.]|nr:D-alanine--D-alanine ligase [Eubacterium sp.]